MARIWKERSGTGTWAGPAGPEERGSSRRACRTGTGKRGLGPPGRASTEALSRSPRSGPGWGIFGRNRAENLGNFQPEFTGTALTLTRPAVPSAVPYEEMRGGNQSCEAFRQSTHSLPAGIRTVRERCICQHQAEKGLGSRVWSTHVNSCSVVNYNQPKMLLGWSQKAL